jgi:hypothetical protein
VGELAQQTTHIGIALASASRGRLVVAGAEAHPGGKPLGMAKETAVSLVLWGGARRNDR